MTSATSLPPAEAAEPLATVTICTRNRSASLAVTLDSLVLAARRAEAHTGLPFEVVIVDNGSTDDTAKVVASYADRLPIRCINQPVPGLSNARNAGLDAARGRFILWTDDDVLVDEDWLAAYLEAFRDHPEVAVFGGRAVPRYNTPRSEWFIEQEAQLGSLLAIRDTPSWTEVKPGQLPFGLNYAVRRDVQLRHRYDPNLGVAPGRRIGGEESTMLRAALAEGGKGRWVWGATVYHLIPAQRQSMAYILDYYRSQGFLYPRLDITAPPRTAIPRAAAMIVHKRIMAAARRMAGRPWVSDYVEHARWRGTLRRLRHPNDMGRA